MVSEPRHKQAYRNLGITLHKSLGTGTSVHEFRAGVRKLLAVYRRALMLEQGNDGDKMRSEEIQGNLKALCEDVAKQCTLLLFFFLSF